ncbi:O-antigen ligase family protein [Flavobacterium sp. LB3P122]|uniref:O-antigen ligase family protein n=1 Tax=Flavobacterium algoriphilum TaxID=3398738 RepID=UPI003A89BFED
MNISEKNFNRIFNLFLFLIASIMIFRKPCTDLIILFAVFNLLFIKKLKTTKKTISLGFIIASPLLIEILFFWNNDSYLMGIKSIEKSISLLIFPMFILRNYQRVQFYKLLQFYSITTSGIVLFFFIRFIVFYPNMIDKYVLGIDLWEIGYAFSNSMGIHAPALNMHLSFVAIINIYFIFDAFRQRKRAIIKSANFVIFSLSFFFVLFVNTRMALFNMLIGFVLVFYYEVIRKYNFKKVVGISAVGLILLGSIFLLFLQKNPYMKEKYSSVTFAYMDKVGNLDAIKNPEIKVFNSFVTRVSIWKSAWELSLKNLPFGVGASDGKSELFKYYEQTNQHFLAKYEFPTHNQFLDFLLKYGFLGPIIFFLYVFTIGYLGFDIKNAIIIAFFFIFFTSNLTDDFLLRFDGIAFSGFWFSIFGSYWLQEKTIVYKEKLIQ